MTTEESTPTSAYLQLGDVFDENSQMEPTYPSAHFLEIKPDGSRQIVYHYRFHSGQSRWASFRSYVFNRKNPNNPVIYWGAATEPAQRLFAPHYLPYTPNDGIRIWPGPDPVNQIPYVQKWMKHITTFAHEIDMLWPEHSIMLREQDNYNLIPGSSVRTTLHNLRNQFTLRYGRGIAGFGYQRVTEWAALDPLQERWKTQQSWSARRRRSIMPYL